MDETNIRGKFEDSKAFVRFVSLIVIDDGELVLFAISLAFSIVALAIETRGKSLSEFGASMTFLEKSHFPAQTTKENRSLKDVRDSRLSTLSRLYLHWLT